MSWARNGLALAPFPHEDTPLQHLRSADGSFRTHQRVVVRRLVRLPPPVLLLVFTLQLGFLALPREEGKTFLPFHVG